MFGDSQKMHNLVITTGGSSAQNSIAENSNIQPAASPVMSSFAHGSKQGENRRLSTSSGHSRTSIDDTSHAASNRQRQMHLDNMTKSNMQLTRDSSRRTGRKKTQQPGSYAPITVEE